MQASHPAMATYIARSFAVVIVVVGTVVALQTPGTSAPVSSGQAGGVLDYGEDLTVTGSYSLSLDPASTSASPIENTWNNLIYDTLIRGGPSGSGLLEPGLATAWNTPNSETITLALRRGVTFQDGTPFDAAAVVFNMHRDTAAWPHDPALAGSLVLDLDGATQTGPYSVALHLDQPVAYEVASTLLTGIMGWIVSPTAAQREGTAYAQHPVGAGPYRLTSNRPDEEISVRRWPGFWQGSGCEPYSSAQSCWRLGGVNFIQTTNGIPAVDALLSGQVDYVRITGAATLQALQDQPEIRFTKKPSATGENYFRICTNHAPFNNPLVDKAISMAISRPAIVQAASGDVDVPTDQLNPPTSPYYSHNLAPAKYAPAVARKIIRQAKAVGATFDIGFPQFDIYDNTAQILQGELKAIGLNPQLEPSVNVVNDLLVEKKFPSVILATVDPGSSALVLPFVSGQISNFCNWSSPLFAQAYQTFSGTLPNSSWKMLWRQVNIHVAQDYLEYPLFYFANVGAYNRIKVGGVTEMQDNGGSGEPVFQTMYLR